MPPKTGRIDTRVDAMLILGIIHQMAGKVDATKIFDERGNWRSPKITEIARASGCSTATVDRVLNERPGVREVTRKRVLDALSSLTIESSTDAASCLKIAFLSDSGAAFNQSLKEGVNAYQAAYPNLELSFHSVLTTEVKPVQFAQQIERISQDIDGLVLVAREDLTINRAVRAVTARGVPVVCVTTDLPNSRRVAYIGNDQTGAGSTAACLMGTSISPSNNRVLLVISAPYRCQEERELGFRRVLRSEYPSLTVEERVSSNDDFEYSYRNVRNYIRDHGPPGGIYNVAGGNTGIAEALRDEGLSGEVTFIGHELNSNSRILLETGGMDFVIGHDLDREISFSIECLRASLKKQGLPNIPSMPVRIFTKYNCF